MADEKWTPGPPHYNVGIMGKGSSPIKGTIGVAWKQSNGRITIKLNPCVVIDTTQQEFSITLFPIGKPIGKQSVDTEDSNIPF